MDSNGCQVHYFTFYGGVRACVSAPAANCLLASTRRWPKNEKFDFDETTDNNCVKWRVCDCVCALHWLRCKSSVVSTREKNEVIMRLDFIVCCAAKEFVIYSRVHSSVCVVNAYSNESYGIQLQPHCHNNEMPIQLCASVCAALNSSLECIQLKMQ